MFGGFRMIKCFQCIKDEYYGKIKWSQVEEAICIFNGTAYCFKHLKEEMEWKENEEYEV